MPTAYGEPIEPAEPANESAENLEQRRAGRYTFDRKELGCEGMSVLAIISAHHERFTAEFFAWWSGQPQPRDKAEVAMIRWERARFGDQLFYSAHGMLWFHIRRRLVSKRRSEEAQP